MPAHSPLTKRSSDKYGHPSRATRTYIDAIQALLALVKEKKIDMFHKSWKPGHGNTDFERYYASPPGEVYRVNDYQHAYEPYVIFKREGTPWSAVQAPRISKFH